MTQTVGDAIDRVMNLIPALISQLQGTGLQEKAIINPDVDRIYHPEDVVKVLAECLETYKSVVQPDTDKTPATDWQTDLLLRDLRAMAETQRSEYKSNADVCKHLLESPNDQHLLERWRVVGLVQLKMHCASLPSLAMHAAGGAKLHYRPRSPQVQAKLRWNGPASNHQRIPRNASA